MFYGALWASSLYAASSGSGKVRSIHKVGPAMREHPGPWTQRKKVAMSVRDHTAESRWDEGMASTVRDGMSMVVQFWAGQIKDMDLPADHAEARDALGEMRNALAVIRDFSG